MDGANLLAMNWLRDHNMGSVIISVRGLIWEKGWCGMVAWSGEFKSVFSSLHFCEVWSTFPWQRLLPERIPINRLWYIFSRIWFYFFLSSKHHFAPSFQPYWEETPVLHSKHKNQNNNKKLANKQNSDTKDPFIYTFSYRTENSGVLSSFISFCLKNFNLT